MAKDQEPKKAFIVDGSQSWTEIVQEVGDKNGFKVEGIKTAGDGIYR